MLNKLKNGFSLVEVMILFAVLAVALAASVPMLSKKTRVVPRTTTHGVYICYPLADGSGVVQEYYNSINSLGSTTTLNPPDSEVKAQCEFNVPKANKFKVELYSAGAGGVQYADIVSQNNGSKTVYLKKDSLAAYAAGQDLRDIFGRENITYIPNNDEFASVFDGLSVKIYNSVGKAGDGGGVTVWYTSPYNAHCRYYGSDVMVPAYVTTEPVGEYAVNANVNKQFKDYCRYIDYKDYITNHNEQHPNYRSKYIRNDGMVETEWIWEDPVVSTSSATSISQMGGIGGSDYWRGSRYTRYNSHASTMYLQAYLSAENARNNNYYETLESHMPKHSDNPCPFLLYLSDTYNNTWDHGYYAVRCSSRNNNDLSGCSAGTPADGEDGESKVIITLDGSDWTRKSENSPYLYALGATKGEDVQQWAGFRVPALSNGKVNVYNHSGEFKTVETKRPTGGQPGRIGMQVKSTSDITINEVYPALGYAVSAAQPELAGFPGSADCAANHVCESEIFNTNYAYYLFRGETTPNPEEEVFYEAEWGNNGEFGPSYNKSPIYSIEPNWAEDRTLEDVYPYAALSTNLYRKDYSLGNPGGAGKHAVYQASQLGTKCTMVVPPGGPVLSYETFISGEEERTEKIEALEKLLEVSITCKDSDNRVVFNKKLNGAKYNLNLNTENSYTWQLSEGQSENELLDKPFEAKTSERPIIKHSKPKWSRIFDRITTLDDKEVGYGGEGTSLVDSCNVPRGAFSMRAMIGNDYIGSGFYKTHNGYWEGNQCYPELPTPRNTNARTYDDIVTLAETTGIYSISPPTQGGPAAIVITW